MAILRKKRNQMSVLRKTLGTSNCLTEIRRRYDSLYDDCSAAYKDGDPELYGCLYREFYLYIRRFRKELKISGEQIENMRRKLVGIERRETKPKYLKEKIEMLDRRIEEETRELATMLGEEEKQRRIRWQ